MASACVRTMTLGQNLHIMPQSCVIISSNNNGSNNSSLNQNIASLAMQPGKTPIAPAPPNCNRSSGTTSILGMNGVNVQQSPSEGSRYKKKYTYANMPYGEQPPSVARRNARERNRVKQVNNGFANLRQHIPQTIITALTNGGRGASKKLSKVDTLRLAVEYIRRLQDVLDESDSDSTCSRNLSNQHSLVTNNPHSSTTCNMSSNISSAASNSSGSSYYSASPEHFNSTPCSDSASSPTPSYSSDISIGSNNYIQSSLQFKFEPYESYSTMKPEDEELLDYISSWQEQ